MSIIKDWLSKLDLQFMVTLTKADQETFSTVKCLYDI